ncbi:MAG: hypothetical protein ACYDG2_21315 [Ruminiclostridium sp.]
MKGVSNIYGLDMDLDIDLDIDLEKIMGDLVKMQQMIREELSIEYPNLPERLTERECGFCVTLTEISRIAGSMVHAYNKGYGNKITYLM